MSKAAAAGLCISPGLSGFSASHQQRSGCNPFPCGVARLNLSSMHLDNFPEIAAAQLPLRLPPCCHISLEVANRSESDLWGQEAKRQHDHSSLASLRNQATKRRCQGWRCYFRHWQSWSPCSTQARQMRSCGDSQA